MQAKTLVIESLQNSFDSAAVHIRIPDARNFFGGIYGHLPVSLE
jgi:hypothetical protein